MDQLVLERQHSISQYIACGHSEWLAWIWKDNIQLHNTLHMVIKMVRLDLERHHCITQYIACGQSEWLAWIWKDNTQLHNSLRVVIVNGSPASGKTTFYSTIAHNTLGVVIMVG